MSRGDDSRGGRGRGPEERGTRDTARPQGGRSSRTSVPMTAERARAIQAHADRTGRNQDFKARAMSAADRNDDADEGEE